jgi:hypothetical protein
MAKRLGSLLRDERLRQERGVVEVAKAAGWHPSSLNQCELGRFGTLPSPAILARLVRTLGGGLSLDDMLLRREVERAPKRIRRILQEALYACGHLRD